MKNFKTVLCALLVFIFAFSCISCSSEKEQENSVSLSGGDTAPESGSKKPSASLDLSSTLSSSEKESELPASQSSSAGETAPSKNTETSADEVSSIVSSSPSLESSVSEYTEPEPQEGIWRKTLDIPLCEYFPYATGSITAELTLDMANEESFELYLSYLSPEPLYQTMEKAGYPDEEIQKKRSEIEQELSQKYYLAGNYQKNADSVCFISDDKEVATGKTEENLLLFKSDAYTLLFVADGTEGNFLGYSELVNVHWKGTVSLPYTKNADPEKYGALLNVTAYLDFQSDTRVVYTLSLTEADVQNYKVYLTEYLDENFFAPLEATGVSKEEAEEKWQSQTGVSSDTWVENAVAAMQYACYGIGGFTGNCDTYMEVSLNNATIQLTVRKIDGKLVVTDKDTDIFFAK